jgi:hypothetical protein
LGLQINKASATAAKLAQWERKRDPKLLAIWF